MPNLKDAIERRLRPAVWMVHPSPPIDPCRFSPQGADATGVQCGWQNSANQNDVTGDGDVTPLDVLSIINYINSSLGSTSLPPPPAAPLPFYDVNGDSLVTPIDVLLVIADIHSHALGLPEWEASISAVAPSLGLALASRDPAAMITGASPDLFVMTWPMFAALPANILWMPGFGNPLPPTTLAAGDASVPTNAGNLLAPPASDRRDPVTSLRVVGICAGAARRAGPDWLLDAGDSSWSPVEDVPSDIVEDVAWACRSP